MTDRLRSRRGDSESGCKHDDEDSLLDNNQIIIIIIISTSNSSSSSSSINGNFKLLCTFTCEIADCYAAVLWAALSILPVRLSVRLSTLIRTLIYSINTGQKFSHYRTRDHSHASGNSLTKIPWFFAPLLLWLQWPHHAHCQYKKLRCRRRHGMRPSFQLLRVAWRLEIPGHAHPAAGAAGARSAGRK